MFKDIKIEIIKIAITIKGDIEVNIFSVCLSGKFIPVFRRKIMIPIGIKNIIITINLLFSTPYLNNMGKLIDT